MYDELYTNFNISYVIIEFSRGSHSQPLYKGWNYYSTGHVSKIYQNLELRDTRNPVRLVAKGQNSLND